MIPVNTPLLDGNEKKYLIECIDTGWISSEGPFIAEFERRFAARVGRKHAIAVCNGTAAIDAVIEAMGFIPGDEIIVPTFTIISCLSQMVRNGIKPVLVDSDPLSWNMNVNQIEKCITKRTRAIMVVHIYGLPVDMDPVLDIAARYGLRVIEDAAEMHGQFYKSKPCGSFGDVSIFSFYPNKHVTSGEGGMILTDSDELANECRSLRNLCFGPKRFVHERLGWNLRMTNMQAAVGLAQLERLSMFVEKKRKMGQVYQEAFKDIVDIQTPLEKTGFAENIYWVFGILLKGKWVGQAEAVMESLAKSGVACRPFFYPMHLQPVFKKMDLFQGGARFPVAENMYASGFYIPSGLGLTAEQQGTVCSKVREVLL